MSVVSNMTVTFADAENPVPNTVTKVPGGPLVLGDNVIFGTTVNNAEALFVPSFALTGYVPFGIMGTMKLASKYPELSVRGCGNGVTSVSLKSMVIKVKALKP